MDTPSIGTPAQLPSLPRKRESYAPHCRGDNLFVAPIGKLCYIEVPRGAVAQPGERFNGIEEVGGSSPPSSTTFVWDVSIAPPRPTPFSYWVVPQRLLAGEYPGSLITLSPKRTIRTIFDTVLALLVHGPRGLKGNRRKIRSLVEAGATLFLDLTEEGELPPYEALLREEAQRQGAAVEYLRVPVKDRTTATTEQMAEALDAIDRVLDSGDTAYVHCMRGIGRTGLVVGCYLVRRGMTGQQALDEIRNLRKGLLSSWARSPETDAQRRMVLEWEG